MSANTHIKKRVRRAQTTYGFPSVSFRGCGKKPESKNSRRCCEGCQQYFDDVLMGYWKATGVPWVKGHVMTDDISLLSSLLTLSLVLRVERPLAHVVRFWAILFALKFLVRCIGWAWRGAGGGLGKLFAVLEISSRSTTKQSELLEGHLWPRVQIQGFHAWSFLFAP